MPKDVRHQEHQDGTRETKVNEIWCLWKSLDPSFGLSGRLIAILLLLVFTIVPVWCWSTFCPSPTLESVLAMWLALANGVHHKWLCAGYSLGLTDFRYLVCSLETLLVTNEQPGKPTGGRETLQNRSERAYRHHLWKASPQASQRLITHANKDQKKCPPKPRILN